MLSLLLFLYLWKGSAIMTSTFSVNIEHVHVQPWGCEIFCRLFIPRWQEIVSVLFDLGILDQRNVRKLLGRQVSEKGS